MKKSDRVIDLKRITGAKRIAGGLEICEGPATASIDLNLLNKIVAQGTNFLRVADAFRLT